MPAIRAHLPQPNPGSASAQAKRAASPPVMLYPALLLNVVIASGTFLVAKGTLVEFPPLPLAMFRFVLATLVLWPIARLLRPHVRIERSDRSRIVMLGVLGVLLNQGLFLIGMQWASASHAALLYALTPAFVVLFGMSGAATRPTAAGVAGIALAFAGVLTLLLQRGLHFETASLRGDLVILVAVVTWALYLVLGRTVTRRYGSLVVTSEAMLAGTIAFLPIGLLSLTQFHPAKITMPAWSGLLYLAWLTSALNYVIWFWGLEHLKPASVAIMTNLQPLFTVAMAWVFLHEPLPAGFVVPTVLVLAGVWLTQAESLRAAKTAARLGVESA